MKNIEKWPTLFRVVKIVDSVLSKILNIFLLVGVVNENQLNGAKDIDLHVSVQIEEDRFVLASLVNEDRLGEILERYRSSVLRWRGQYQAMSKALVAACEEALEK